MQLKELKPGDDADLAAGILEGDQRRAQTATRYSRKLKTFRMRYS
jgi:hypothetical protein